MNIQGLLLFMYVCIYVCMHACMFVDCSTQAPLFLTSVLSKLSADESEWFHFRQ